MKQAAELLGNSEDVEKYRELAAAVKKAFNEKFFDKETRKYDRNSQAANAMALYVGLVEPENEEIVFQNLIDDIRSRGNALTAGDVGYRYVVQTLLDRGASDVLFDMNSRYDVPGYGYQLAMGETALAESWQSRDYLSHNHCMLGHLYSWLFAGLGGISQTDTSTAYKEIVIDPQVVGDINSARASFVSPRGLIRSEWKDMPERFELTVEIPATSEALVVLPAETSDRISENGVPVDRVDAVRIERSEKGRTTLRIGSGTYRFVVEK